MRGRAVPIIGLTTGEIAAWQELADSAVEPNPLFEPACLLPAARHLPKGGEIALVVAEEGDRMFGCLPVLRVPWNVRPSLSWEGVKRPTFTAQVRRFRFDGTPLFRQDRGDEAAVAMLTALRSLEGARSGGILVLESTHSDGPVARHLSAAAQHLGVPMGTIHSYIRPVLYKNGPASYTGTHRSDLTTRHSPSDRGWHTLKWKGRRLGRQLSGEVELVDRSDDPSAVDMAVEMEATGYKGTTVARRFLPGVGEIEAPVAMAAWPGEPEWYREMCSGFRGVGRLVVHSLQVGDVVLALQLRIRGGDGLFLITTVFDETYARYSPGTQLDLKVIERFRQDDQLAWLDSCTYEQNAHYSELYGSGIEVSTVVIGLGKPLDDAALRGHLAARRWLGVESPLRRNREVDRALGWLSSKYLRS